MRVIALIPFGLAYVVFAGISCIRVGIKCVERWDLEAYNNRENMGVSFFLKHNRNFFGDNSHDNKVGDSFVAQVLLFFAVAFAILNIMLWAIIMQTLYSKKKTIRSRMAHKSTSSADRVGYFLEKLGKAGDDFLIESEKILADKGHKQGNISKTSCKDMVGSIEDANEKSRNICVFLIFYLSTSIFVGFMAVGAHMFYAGSSNCMNTTHVFTLIGLTYGCALLDSLQALLYMFFLPSFRS
eukprot:Nk52_evm80s2118 gene=Nk52_evmTU80s2118